jgi:XisI protein
MANLATYQEAVQSLLSDISSQSVSDSGIESQTLFDTVRNHYQVVHVGWHNHHRVYGCVLHIDIKDGKVWVQHNGTERAIADDLMERGVPAQDIVLGFHSPSKRKFTEFAVG